MENKEDNRKYLIIIILLLLSNLTFVYLYISNNVKKVEIAEELVDTQEARDDLQKILKETETTLSEYKGRNAALDEEIRIKTEEIQAKAAEIEKLLKDKKVSSRALEKAREELDVLRYYVQKYQKQIDSLSRENKFLASENRKIKQDLTEQKDKNEGLIMENIKLGNKVAVGARLKADNIYVTGIQNRDGGKTRETNRVRRIDQIKVEFVLAENFVAEKGDKDFFLRILGPDGETIWSETTGGGKFEFQGAETPYTSRKRHDFQNTNDKISFFYAKSSEWEKGDYKIEVYAEGFLIGEQKFKLY